MRYKAGDKVKANGSIQEIESITQWDKDIQRYEFIGGSGWHKIKDYDEKFCPFAVKRRGAGRMKWAFWKRKKKV